MNIEKIKIHDKEYKVEIAESSKDKEKGLSNRDSLDKDKGMLFDFSDEIDTVSFWMKDTTIPLDIIFIDEDLEVIKVGKGEPESTKGIKCDNVAYVLELNQDSGVEEGDVLEFIDEDGPVMKILASDGSTQMPLWGGERIVSRKETKILVKKAKKAEDSQSDTDFKALGKYIFKVFTKQDNRDPEYVNLPEN